MAAPLRHVMHSKKLCNLDFKSLLPHLRWQCNTSQSARRKTPVTMRVVGKLCMSAFAGFGMNMILSKHDFLMNSSSSSSTTVFAESNKRPVFRFSRQIKNENDNSGLKITLYQYQTCPFCCKVRAFLDYNGLSYDVIEVNSVRQTQIKWSKYKKVPIVVLDGIGEDGYIQLNDSSAIISLLNTYLLDQKQDIYKLQKCYPAIESKNEKGKTVYEFPNKYFIMHFDEKLPKTEMDGLKEERKWREWSDSVMVHMLSPNVYRTPSEALQAFTYFDEVGNWKQNFSTFERYMVKYVGAAAMYIIGKILKKRYSLKDDVRQSLYDASNHWTNALTKQQTKFMGGDQPNLGDLAVYGSLSSIEGCDAFQDLLRNTKISGWYYDMKTVTEIHQGSQTVR